MKVLFLFILGVTVFSACGCCTTEEHLANLGESVHNIALDGDGIN